MIRNKGKLQNCSLQPADASQILKVACTAPSAGVVDRTLDNILDWQILINFYYFQGQTCSHWAPQHRPPR